MHEKIYLGDSVYCKYEDGRLSLYLDNGLDHHNKIILEPEVALNLNRVITRIFKLRS